MAEIELRGNFEIQPAAVVNGLTASIVSGGTQTLSGVQNLAAVSVGQLVSGPGIPANTYVVGYNTGNQFNLNQGVGQGGTTTGNNNVTISTTAGLVPGMTVAGTGIPAGATVASITNATTFVFTVAANPSLTATATGNANLTFGTGALTFSGAGWRDISVGDNWFTGLDFATISGVISGAGNIGKQGGGPLILGNANTYSGNTILRNEQLIISSIGAAGATSSSLGTNVLGGWLELGNPGGGNAVTLTYAGPGEIATRAIYIAGTTGSRRIEASGSGPLTLTNVINANAATTLTAFGSSNERMLELRGVNTDLNTISSVLANSAALALRIYKADQGVWVLSGANTFTGGVRIEGGSLGFASAAAMGVLSNVAGTSAASAANIVTLTAGTTAGLAVGTLVSGYGFAYADQVTGVTNSTTFTINANRGLLAGGNVVFGGILMSNGTVFAADPAGLIITQPILINNNAMGGFSGLYPITVNANVYKFAGGNDSTFTNSLENGSVLTINGDYINWQNDTNTRMLSIRGQGAKTVWNGQIANSLAAGPSRLNISIPNSSIFQLTGSAANTFTGGIILYQGDLRLSKAGALGTGTLQLEGGTVLGDGVELTGANKITNQVLLNGEHTKFIGSNSVEVSGNLLNNNGNRYLFNDITGAGKSLTFLGGVNLSHDTNNRILVYGGSGVTNFSSAIANGGGSSGSSIYYRGTGTHR